MVAQSDRAAGWQRWRLFLVALVLVTSALVIGRGVVYAQSEAPAASADVSAVTPDEVNAVARELWCPLCSGVRLDSCELKACDQMKDVIAIKLAEGENTDSIKAYFIEQYGPQVMGEPPRSGFNWLAWILPALAAVVGGYFFWRTTQRMMLPATAPGVSTGPMSPASAAGAATAKATSSDVSGKKLTEEEEYMEKLEEELAKYG
jgi:cytochrome c-type biogenesis protein CcmH